MGPGGPGGPIGVDFGFALRRSPLSLLLVLLLISFAIHLVIVLAVWIVTRSIAHAPDHQPVRLTFFAGGRPPPPPPPPPGGASARQTPRHPRPHPAHRLVAPTAIQPEPTPTQEPEPEEEEEPSGQGPGEPGGVPGGVAGGVPGGVVGGTLGGTLGGEGSPMFVGASQRPRRIAGDDPTFTREARASQAQGTIVMRFVVNERGEVADAQILSSSIPSMNQAVLSTVRQWRFQPFVYHDQPTPISFIQRFDFVFEH